MLAPLRNRTFFSLAEVNAAYQVQLAKLNAKPFQKMAGSRLSLYESLERPALSALPAVPYEFALWKRASEHRLPRPGRRSLLLGALSARRTRGGRFVTAAEHMPAAHRRHLEWTPSRLIAWGESVGPATGALVAGILELRLASLLTVVNAAGPEMNQSETVTLLNDMCLLAPATLIDPRVAWDELDPLSVRVTFSNAGNTVSAVLSFDDSGALVDFVSDDRSRTTDGKTYELAFAYARFEILGIDYNVTAD